MAIGTAARPGSGGGASRLRLGPSCGSSQRLRLDMDAPGQHRAVEQGEDERNEGQAQRQRHDGDLGGNQHVIGMRQEPIGAAAYEGLIDDDDARRPARPETQEYPGAESLQQQVDRKPAERNPGVPPEGDEGEEPRGMQGDDQRIMAGADLMAATSQQKAGVAAGECQFQQALDQHQREQGSFRPADRL